MDDSVFEMCLHAAYALARVFGCVLATLGDAARYVSFDIDLALLNCVDAVS